MTDRHRNRSASPTNAFGDGNTIRLDGIYKLIAPVIATQRENFAKVILGCCREMLELDRDIRRRYDTLLKFETKYQDEDDLDASNRPKVKPYIPVSLRTKLSVSCSQLVQKDGRCSQELTEIQTRQERARNLHEAYKTNVAAELKGIAEIEIKARRKLFGYTYSQSIITIAEGLVIIAKNMPGRQPLEMSVRDVAKIATVKALSNLPTSHWEDARFVPADGEKEFRSDAFIRDHITHHNIDENIVAEMQQSTNPTEKAIANYVIRKLGEWWPTLTHLLWSADVKRDHTKRLDAELSDLFESKAIVKANKQLADAMETGADQTVRPLVEQIVRREMAKKISANKKASRKKSSGGPKNQGSTPENSGQSNRANSGEKAKSKNAKSNRQSKKKSKDDTELSDDDKSAASNESRKRGRSPKPRSILKTSKKSKFLKNHDDYIVVEADKNLGGCLLSRDDYITRAFMDHLGDEHVYQRIPQLEAYDRQINLANRLKSLLMEWDDNKLISQAESRFLLKSIEPGGLIIGFRSYDL
ncbi:hypothetical protein ACHAXA_003742 [Cyclostephanos tholiformis]|uniref:Uncharacterized protein n=1 Tax=Cyclostephanos tholiformis TaxID=382380 RepID=A0ABD3STC0_9STRA